MVNITFKHGIGDRVYIHELERPGYVLGLYHGETGSQYRVSYFDDGSKKSEYFSDKEIRPFNRDKRSFGFETPEQTIKHPVKVHHRG